MPAPLTRVFPSRIGESRAAGAHLLICTLLNLWAIGGVMSLTQAWHGYGAAAEQGPGRGGLGEDGQ